MTFQHGHAHDDGTSIHEAQEPSVGELTEGEARHGREFRRAGSTKLSGDDNDSIGGST